jgi:demethylmenaquinone methyltransferase / 2-methoxy-6-polyprenyl-1,4-benzoquinol methylase
MAPERSRLLELCEHIDVPGYLPGRLARHRQRAMSSEVRTMFSEIAPRYDLTNQVLSFGIHRMWREAAVRLSGAKSGDAVLDCATGTGDLALAFKRRVGHGGKVVGTDFCKEMLAAAPKKAQRAGLDVQFEMADALALPYRDCSFDVASIAFGIRNVDDPVRCLRELSRVVKPGGRVVVLEFGQPTGAFGALFRLYSRRVMPKVGQLLTGHRAAYEYLPRTASVFPAGERFLALMQQTGTFGAQASHPLTFGIAFVYVGFVER